MLVVAERRGWSVWTSRLNKVPVVAVKYQYHTVEVLRSCRRRSETSVSNF